MREFKKDISLNAYSDTKLAIELALRLQDWDIWERFFENIDSDWDKYMLLVMLHKYIMGDFNY